MAGTVEAISTNNLELIAPTQNSQISALIDQWQVQYARFINYSSSTFRRTHSSLTPKAKNCLSRGTWISTDAASLKLVYQRSCTGLDTVVIVLSLPSRVLEEHYISKMHFSWPQVSCLSGFPARGSRAVFVSYKDGDGQIQKFGLRFSTIYETEKFMNVVKELCLENGSPQLLQASEFNSELSSQAEVIPSTGAAYRTGGHSQCTSADNNAQPLLPISNLSAAQDSVSHKEKIGNHEAAKTEKMFGAAQDSAPHKEKIGNHEAAMTETTSVFPPSFTQLLKDCQAAVPEAKPTESGQDLKTQFVQYLKGTSFKELLATVESVISELGDEVVL